MPYPIPMESGVIIFLDHWKQLTTLSVIADHPRYPYPLKLPLFSDLNNIPEVRRLITSSGVSINISVYGLGIVI